MIDMSDYSLLRGGVGNLEVVYVPIRVQAAVSSDVNIGDASVKDDKAFSYAQDTRCLLKTR